MKTKIKNIEMTLLIFQCLDFCGDGEMFKLHNWARVIFSTILLH